GGVERLLPGRRGEAADVGVDLIAAAGEGDEDEGGKAHHGLLEEDGQAELGRRAEQLEVRGGEPIAVRGEVDVADTGVDEEADAAVGADLEAGVRVDVAVRGAAV